CRPGPWLVLFGGGMLGIGIACSHRLAAAAIEIPGRIIWSPGLALAALGLAAGLGMAAGLVAAGREKPRTTAAATGLLMLGIVGHHVTAMAAFRIAPGQVGMPAGLPA